ncbi:penicillin-binding protein 2 [Parabacteroides sp. An277]|uniref:penicillin-binding protein 2 n=1 Tax=Parabacteroides sp. An277 TaxID=1965619 RepID=UPI000B38DAA8|nr:penicillin-binding protein 2 [Parabacteroides sp. An277]OUO52356.1 penicillin-binding protein 2 [Parabacteroides sp. An277]
MENKLKYQFENRRFVIGGAVIVIVLIFIVRLFYLQIVDNDYKAWADSNAFLKRTVYPARGIMYDRNGKLLVYNQPAYDVMLVMREIQPFDTLDFCHILGITKEQFLNRIEAIQNRRLNPGYSSYTPQVFMTQLSAQECGVLQEKLYKFPGFYVQNRTIREYAYPNAALLLGNVGEVNKRDLEKDSYYTIGDNSGRTGIESSYEKYLRGEKGVEILLRDAHGRIQGRYEEGKHDVAPVSGKNLKLSIDIELQAYGEKLMQNKLGGIVMIEPETGEVLCMVSSPTYDPSLLVGRIRGKNYAALQKDPLKPLFNRPLMAQYPPGSTFKPTQGLIFLQEGVIKEDTRFTCAHGYTYRGGKPACHGHPSPLPLVGALATSCNSFFPWGLHYLLDDRSRYPSVQQAFDVWKDYMVSMGYGYRLGIDLPGEKRGYIPNSKVYDKIYRGRWNSSTVISIAIGQGEILATPLQICNLAATIANRGFFITPHVVKEIQDTPLDSLYTERRYTGVDTKYYPLIAEGMRGAVVGSAWGATCRGANLPDIEVCGKTGTAENPHGKDHSIFMGFAPYEHPKVAIAVFVENAGFGATYAVPIGRLMMEKYLRDSILPESRPIEEYILNANILPNAF